MEGQDVLKLQEGDTVRVKVPSKGSFEAKIIGFGYDDQGRPSHLLVRDGNGKDHQIHYSRCELITL